jgi:hypothetical protein
MVFYCVMGVGPNTWAGDERANIISVEALYSYWTMTFQNTM